MATTGLIRQSFEACQYIILLLLVVLFSSLFFPLPPGLLDLMSLLSSFLSPFSLKHADPRSVK